MTISSISMNNATRSSIARIQRELTDAFKEQGKTRHADVGLTLGAQTAQSVTYRIRESALDRQLQSNKLVDSQMELTDNALGAVAAGAEKMKTALTSSLSIKDANALAITVGEARSSLEQMAGALNTEAGGRTLFSGDNIAKQPFDAATGSAAVKKHFADFLVAAGRTAATLTKTELTAYLGAGFTDTATPPQTWRFSDNFADAAWKANWSSASDGEMRTAISPNETISTSFSANHKTFRDLAATYSMIADLGIGGLTAENRDVIAETARTRIQAGIDGTTSLRTEIGFRRARIESADEQTTAQMDIASAAWGRLENVDPAEVATRITQLETQLEASYTVTGRLQKLNILDYI